MKNTTYLTAITTAAACLAMLSAFTYASTQPADQFVSSATFVSGGVGEGDQVRMHNLAPEYRLHLVFARKPDGAYLSHVPVAIRDRNGHTVFELSNSGPLLFVNLPQGDYRITATAYGVPQMKPVTLLAHGTQDVKFFWNNNPA